MNGLWERTADRLREELGQVAYETWIAPLNCTALQGKTITIEAPNRFFRDWVNERYLARLRQTLAAEAGEGIDVRLTLGENGTTALPTPAANGRAQRSNHVPAPSEAARHDRHPKLNPRYTFAEFVVGSGNQFAHAAAQAVANQPGEKFNPLFIYGGVGLGKTHLVTAIGHHICAGDRGRKVLFMPAEVFMNELINSIRRDKMDEFREKFRRVDALILDDVQFLAGRERTQEEFFHTFNSLHAERHQIVLTSDQLPHEIPGLEERLRNRFESGLIADIQPPDLETRVAIVQKKAVLEKLQLSSEVALYIAQSVESNVRELEGCLTRLVALASLNKTPENSAITLEFARQALHFLIRNHDAKPDVEMIQRTVADFFHIRLADLKSKKRTQHIAFCRQVAMYLCRKLTDSSFPTIGEHFSRDHSTVIHAYNLIQRRVTSDSAFRLSLEKIERELKAIRAHAA
ncbi:MAG TPA: chromosomal replication initiator protein DnaA [Candidatus Binataceae bacterium]|nr:chromosomal replication initiator protein DnaA [Candidatus Binataceae bacterium]